MKDKRDGVSLEAYLQSEMNFLLLMEEILDQLIGSLSHYKQGFIHPRWCRISSINSMYLVSPNFNGPSRYGSIYLWLDHCKCFGVLRFGLPPKE